MMTQQQQMFIVSDCLLRLGCRKLAIEAQTPRGFGFLDDYVTLIARSQDDTLLDKLHYAGLIG